MNILELGNLDNIEGRPAGKDAEGNDLYYRLLPKPMIELNLEIALHHPKLQVLLDEGLRSDAYDISNYFGIIFAYCGIVLDSTGSEHGYSVLELCEQGVRALVNKRDGLAVSVNTIPTSEMLMKGLMDLKEGNKEAEIVTAKRIS